jgi:hypothetical protein
VDAAERLGEKAREYEVLAASHTERAPLGAGSRAFAGGPSSVTDRREGHPRSGLTGAGTPATPATERAVEEPRGVGSSNTRPRASSGTPDAGGWFDGRDLRAFRGYVVNRWTGEVLSSVIADVIRERAR